MPLVSGSTGLVSVPQGAITGNGPPGASFRGQLGQQYFDTSVTPPEGYVYNGASWVQGGLNQATTTLAGTVLLATLAQTESGGAPTADYVSSANDVATALSAIVVGAGVPATIFQQGYVFLATNAQAEAGLLTDNHVINPGSLAAALSNAASLPIGNGSAGSGAFTTLGATTVTFTAGGTWASGGTAITIGSDATTDTINIGTAASARAIHIGDSTQANLVTIGSATGNAALTLKAGAGNFVFTSQAGMTATMFAANTTGAITIGGTAQSTGAITLGNSSATNTLNLGIGNGANTTNIATGTGGNTLHIADGAGTNTVTIASNAGSINTLTLGSSFSTSTSAS